MFMAAPRSQPGRKAQAGGGHVWAWLVQVPRSALAVMDSLEGKDSWLLPGCRWCGVSKSVKRGSVGTALCDVLGVALPPQFKAAIQAVHLGKALVRQVGRRALTGIAVVAD